MEIIKELESLSEFIKVQSSVTLKQANKNNDDFTRGLLTGYSDTYNLCAKWIDELLERESKS